MYLYSYMTATFVIETMATANAVRRFRSFDNISDGGQEDGEDKPLLSGSTQSNLDDNT